MKHIIAALLAVISIATAADYDSAGRQLTASRLSAIKAETPARQSRCIDGDRHYYSLADSNAWHAAQAAYLAAKPTTAEVIQAQQAVTARTNQLLGAAYVQAAPNVRLRMGDLGAWTALVVMVPPADYPYTVDAYTDDGVGVPYQIESVTALQLLLGQGAAIRRVITNECMSIRAAMAAASSRAALAAIQDGR